MFFRDELKETMETLKLTRELELSLKKNFAHGNSLSDMIKSYEYINKNEFEEEYEFRAYKRSLLDGRYNPLRWVAHERNQVMHKSDYLIGNYLKFKYTIKDASEYFNSGRIKKITKEYLLLSFFKYIPYFAPLLALILFNGDKISLEKFNFSFSGILIGTIVTIFVLAFFIRIGEILSVILDIFYNIYNTLQFIATKKKFIFLLLILSYFFGIKTYRT